MRVLMISDMGFEYGGGEIYMYNLKNELEKNGHAVKVFTTNVRQKNDDKIKSDYICIGVSGKLNRILKVFNFFAYFKLKRILKEFKPDVVHIHSFLTNLSPAFPLDFH